ncbi:hypothetical protein Ancab_013806 [Ancistrocladus abbreviatus]
METGGDGEEDHTIFLNKQRSAGMVPDCVGYSSSKMGYESELGTGSALISMYGKCGVLEDAFRKHVLLLFEQMKRDGCTPDEIMVPAVLQACSYCCLLEYGLCSKYGIRPVIEHFVGMVDLLSRAGLLTEAADFISGSPFK